jgi:hypothetical protein
MDPNVYKTLTKAHKLVRESKGDLKPEDIAWLAGILESILDIYQDVEPVEAENPTLRRRILG